MPSEVDICNNALGLVGGNFITSLNDDSTEAKLCKRFYPIARDAALEERDWTFATARKSLVKLAEEPAFTWASQFNLPANCMRVISVWGPDAEDGSQTEFVKEGVRILCDEEVVNIQYIDRLTNPERFSPLFTDALIYAVASKIAIPLTESRSLLSDMLSIYRTRIKEAGANDGMQSKIKIKTGSKLMRSRQSNRTFRDGRGGF